MEGNLLAPGPSFKVPLFKAVLIVTNEIPFKLEPDVPEELEGRLRWAERNYNFHKEKAETLRNQIEQQSGTFGIFPKYLPKQMKEERALRQTIP